jgi:hypothetical protein
MRLKRGMGMELFGRRWDRLDAIVAAAAVILIVVSNKPWWELHIDTTAAKVPSPEGVLVGTWNAWRYWHWSGAVALGTLAAGVHLAYRGRPRAKGAASLAVFMLLGSLGLVAWQWHRASDTEVKDLSGRILTMAPPNESPEDERRRTEKLEDKMTANARPLPTRSTPRSGIYAGAGFLILMSVAIAHGLVRQPRQTPAG